MPRPAVCAISALPTDAVLAIGAAVVAVAITLDVVAKVDAVVEAPHFCAGHISRSGKSCEGGEPPPKPYPPVLQSISAAGHPPLLRSSHAYPPPLPYWRVRLRRPNSESMQNSAKLPSSAVVDGSCNSPDIKPEITRSLSCTRWRPRRSRRPSPVAWDPIVEQLKLNWSTLLW